MGVKIKDLPVDDRPIERMISNGAKALTNEELLAIIIKILLVLLFQLLNIPYFSTSFPFLLVAN